MLRTTRRGATRDILSGCSNGQFTGISQLLSVIKRVRSERGRKALDRKKRDGGQEAARPLIEAIKVSGSNSSDVQGFAEFLKIEGPGQWRRRERRE